MLRWTAHRRSDSWPLHLVEQPTNGTQICDVRAVRVERALSLGALRQRVNEELGCSARVHLEMEVTGDGVLPKLLEGELGSPYAC